MTRPASGRQMLNLGCGLRLHPAWINADIVPRHPDVVSCDVRAGLPFRDDQFDIVYHSHLIEHIRRMDVHGFLRECGRVLKPGGILRIATPDTERLCELYVDRARALAAGRVEAEFDHEWLLIEMYDQAVREHSGGAMLDYLRQNPLPNEAFVFERIGEEGRDLLVALRSSSSAVQRPDPGLLLRLVNGVRRRIIRARDALLQSCYGEDALAALTIGRFRLSGEVHHWLYDRWSLARVLRAAGFSEPVVRTATESAIQGWSEFFLDGTPAGDVTKPDSLFMEARKPE